MHKKREISSKKIFQIYFFITIKIMEQTIRLNPAECNHFRNDKKEILGFKRRSCSDIQIKFIKKNSTGYINKHEY
jgi:hypothetical protein